MALYRVHVKAASTVARAATSATCAGRRVDQSPVCTCEGQGRVVTCPPLGSPADAPRATSTPSEGRRRSSCAASCGRRAGCRRAGTRGQPRLRQSPQTRNPGYTHEKLEAVQRSDRETLVIKHDGGNPRKRVVPELALSASSEPSSAASVPFFVSPAQAGPRRFRSDQTSSMHPAAALRRYSCRNPM